MNTSEFEDSLTQPEPPAGLPPLVEALWWEAHGDWERAHTMTQEIETAQAALVHAYLHRREGDLGNAAYWYRRAGRPVTREPFEVERRELVGELLRAN